MDYADVTYRLASLHIWGAVEVNLAIICACMTTLKPLVARVFPQLLQSGDRGTPGSLGYIERRPWTAVSVPRNPDSRAKQGSTASVELDTALSNDSGDCEMDDLEKDQIQRGVYMAMPAEAIPRADVGRHGGVG